MRKASDVRGTAEGVVNRKLPGTYVESDKLAALKLGAQIGISAAARELSINRKSFYRWIEEFPEQWSDLQKVRSARLDDLVDRYSSAEDKAIDRAIQLLDGEGDPLDARDTAALIKAMGSSRQAATVGARQVRGDPDQTATLQVNFPALEAAAEALLQRAGETKAIEGTAEEVDG
jgi:hypothetical protein